MTKINNLIQSYLKKQNLFDLIGVISFFLILIVAALFFLRKGQYVYVTLRVSNDRILREGYFNRSPEWYIENLPVGLEDIDLLGKVNAEVVRVYYYPKIDVNQTVFVTLKLRSVYNQRTKQYSYNGLPVLIGGYQNININGVSMSGIVHEIGESFIEVSKIKEKKYLVTGTLETQANEIIKFTADTGFEGIKKTISKNLAEGIVSKDSEGKTIATIKKIKRSPARRTFISGNYLASAIDPKRENIELEMEVLTKEINGRFLYQEESPIILNTIVGFNFESFEIVMTVNDFEEVED